MRRFSTIVKNTNVIQSWLKNKAYPLTDPYQTLKVATHDGILSVGLNRPEKYNAMNMEMWQELENVYDSIDSNVRAVVLYGEGKVFSSGMDLSVFSAVQELSNAYDCQGRKREMLLCLIERLQNIISKPERCRVPVIAKVHGMCIGGAVDMITACDLRYCEAGAEFSVKEIDLAIVADIGTLQRLPNIVGEMRAKELAYTGRHFSGAEAHDMKLVLENFEDKERLDEHVEKVAQLISKKSPLTIRGTKEAIHFQRDHSTQDSLYQVRAWNASMLHSDDLEKAFVAQMKKEKPTFMD